MNLEVLRCQRMFVIGLWIGMVNMVTFGQSTFTDTGQTLGNSTSKRVALGDLNGDGRPDAFVANSSGANKVWFNNGVGTFSDSGQFLGSANSEGVVLVDLDGLNGLDVVVANAFADNQVWVNDGTGLFTAGQAFEPMQSNDVAMGDLNGDNFVDFFFANHMENSVWFNDGSGMLINSGQSLGSSTSYSVALGDLDGDGDLDAFLANGGSGVMDRIWVNQGGAQLGTEGQFADSGQTLGTAWAYDVDLGDLDGDGDLDAFLANWFPNANTVWINQGGIQGGIQGVFNDSGQSLGSAASLGVSLSDVDGDSDLDAFVANNFPEGNRVWLNNGSASFVDSGQTLGAASTHYDAALTDLDGDGDIDAFSAAFEPNFVFRNDSPPPVNPEGWQIQGVATRANVGLGCAIALDSNGRPHMAYVRRVSKRSGNDAQLFYVRWDGIQWQSMFVDEAPYMVGDGGFVSLCLDSNDLPHIAYSAGSFGTRTPRYAHWNGSWDLQDIGLPDEAINPQVSLQLDSMDRPHIVYFDQGSREIRYRMFDGTWTVETIYNLPVGLSQPIPRLALDSLGVPHVSFMVEGMVDYDVYHATRTGMMWQLEVISVTDGTFNDYSAIAIDSMDRPLVAYADGIFADQLKLAAWDGVNWQIETAYDGESFFNKRVNLMLASDDTRHLTLVVDDFVDALLHLQKNGASWEIDVIDNSAPFGSNSHAVLDGSGSVMVCYYTTRYATLRYASWGPNWQVQSLPDPGQTTAVSISVYNNKPNIAYANQSTGQILSSQWEEPWMTEPVDFIINPVLELDSSSSDTLRHISYYDADNQTLLFTYFKDGIWGTVTVDDTADVGRYNRLVGNRVDNIRIAYWNATSQRIRLAISTSPSATFDRYTNAVGPALDSTSGSLSISSDADRNIFIAYHDGVNDDLRLATWNNMASQFTDVQVYGAGVVAGRVNSIQCDGSTGFPTIATIDESSNRLVYGWFDGGGWNFDDAITLSENVTSLALTLGLDSYDRPRILYTIDSGVIRIAAKRNGVWFQETITDSAVNSIIDAALDARPHVAFINPSNQVAYAFRNATLDVDVSDPAAPPYSTGGYYNPLAACSAVQDLFLPKLGARHAKSSKRNQLVPSLLDDLSVFGAMTALFDATPGGQHFLNFYDTHASEMGQLGIANPFLLWDSYGTLQNFIPGIEAMVSGNGDEFIVDQQMVDDALDIWQRLATAGSTELADAINVELTASNNLQDWVGLSFDEWAEAIGVAPHFLESLWPYWRVGGDTFCGNVAPPSILTYVCLINSGETCANLSACPL